MPSESSQRRSYAVTWREGDGPVRAGKLWFGPTGLRLEGGTARGRLSAQQVFYGALSEVETARRPEERVRGRPTLILRRSGRPSLAIACVNGPGYLRELAEKLGHAIADTFAA